MSITAKLKQRAKQLTADIPAVFLAMKDRRTPMLAKILAAIAVAYALSPIDLIPDFIPVIGYLDDVLLLPILIVAAVKLIPEPSRYGRTANSGQKIYGTAVGRRNGITHCRSCFCGC